MVIGVSQDLSRQIIQITIHIRGFTKWVYALDTKSFKHFDDHNYLYFFNTIYTCVNFPM